MEQRRGDSASSTEKEACDGSQTDFSVTNRLLPSGSSGITPPIATHSKTAGHGIPTTLPGWHLLLPSDQGTVSTRHPIPPWQAVVPNVVFAAPSSSAYYAATVSYGSGLRGSEKHTTAGSMPVAGLGEGSSVDTGVSNMSQKANGSDKDNAAEKAEEEEVEQSEDDSDGESSQHSHSSPGRRDSIDEPKKPKRTRTAYSNYQLDQLEMWFQRCQYPDVFVREELATTLGIREDRIQVWFQNRRARFRKQERTGSVRHRSRHRLRRAQKAVPNTCSSIPMGLPNYAQYATPHSSSLVLPTPPPPPQPQVPYVTQYQMPRQIDTLPGYQPHVSGHVWP